MGVNTDLEGLLTTDGNTRLVGVENACFIRHLPQLFRGPCLGVEDLNSVHHIGIPSTNDGHLSRAERHDYRTVTTFARKNDSRPIFKS